MINVILSIVASCALASSHSAVKETLIWLKEKEHFIARGCRLAKSEDVRQDKVTELGDVLLVGSKSKVPKTELNMGHYTRIRISETGADTLGSRLGRMGFSLIDVPTRSCEVWNRVIK